MKQSQEFQGGGGGGANVIGRANMESDSSGTRIGKEKSKQTLSPIILCIYRYHLMN